MTGELQLAMTELSAMIGEYQRLRDSILSHQGRINEMLGAETATVDDPLEVSEKVKEVVMAVARHYRIKPGDIYGRSKQFQFSQPRLLASYLAYERTSAGFYQIAGLLNRSDHTAICYAHNQIKKRREIDKKLDAAIKQIELTITPGKL